MEPAPNGVWGLPKEMYDQISGYGPDVEKNRAEGRKIMEKLGYGPDNKLKLKVSTRNHLLYRDPAVFEKWYKLPHSCPDLAAKAAYGLVELNRDAIRNASIVGNPGCYPTTMQLGYYPLLKAGNTLGIALTATQKQQLIAFLGTLTDETYLTNPAYAEF